MYAADRARGSVAITRSAEGQNPTEGQDQAEEGKGVSEPSMWGEWLL